MLKVYLAGPDVFMGRSILEEKVRLAKEAGLEPLPPADIRYSKKALLEKDPEKFKVYQQYCAFQIWKANKRLINKCDIVLANLQPFRGVELDTGTAVEIGYAHGRKKIIIGYGDFTTTYKDKVLAAGLRQPDFSSDDNGYSVEDFNLGFNLMAAFCVVPAKDFQDAINKAKAVL